jgi:hypothetical protein
MSQPNLPNLQAKLPAEPTNQAANQPADTLANHPAKQTNNPPANLPSNQQTALVLPSACNIET